MSIYQGGTKQLTYPEWEEEQRKLKIRTRPVGSKATLNGKPVVWAGPDYEWQSPESFKKLDDAEYFAPTEHLARTGLKILNKLEPVGNFIGKVGQGLYEAFVEPYQGPLQKQIMTNTVETLAAVPEVIGYGADKLTPHGAVGPATSLLIGAVGQELIENRLPLIGKLPPGTKKLSALERYRNMVDQGFDMSKDTKIQRLINKVDSVDSLPKHIIQYTDESTYRQSVNTYLDGGGVTADIRDKVGVFVDKDGSVKQMQSRGKLQLRSEVEKINTNLNRELNRFLQSPEHISYDKIANVRHFMQEIGFKGDEKQFKALYELHHVNALKVYAPFFTGLDPKQAAELRKLAEGAKIYLGNDPRNLTPLLKRKHRVDPDSIHTFMRENGIEGSSKWSFLSTAGNKAGSYDPQQRMMLLLQGRSVQERFEVLKGIQEWVQEPANQHLSTLKNMKDYQ